MDNILTKLAACTIDILIILLRKYECKEIDYATFCSCAKMKVAFLEVHLNETKFGGLIILGNIINLKYYQIKNSCYLKQGV